MKTIKLLHGQECMVDDEDFETYSGLKWSMSNSGYAQNNKRYMHRMITSAPKGMQVDHINGNKLDNQKENLRVCTRSQNTANRKKQPNNTSGYKGVVWDTYTNRWCARIQINSKHINLGRFDYPKDAALIYDDAAEKYFGEYAITNRSLGLL